MLSVHIVKYLYDNINFSYHTEDNIIKKGEAEKIFKLFSRNISSACNSPICKISKEDLNRRRSQIATFY